MGGRASPCTGRLIAPAVPGAMPVADHAPVLCGFGVSFCF